MVQTTTWDSKEPATRFRRRHIGPSSEEQAKMLEFLDYKTLDDFVDAAMPGGIRSAHLSELGEGMSEEEMLASLSRIANRNQVWRSYIGAGYYGTLTPAVLQRNIIEDPGWYTQYTPYQPEISQGRLEMLLNFQTMVIDLTGLPVANASLLDEGTAAAEAMTMFHRLRPRRSEANVFFVSASCHPQTIAVVQTRAAALKIDVVMGDEEGYSPDAEVFGCLLQYPGTLGEARDYSAFIESAHEVGALVAVAADLLSLAVLREPGEMGADVAVGSTQRFGVPMGFGGPHAGYMATRDAYKRQMPGRLIGVTVDTRGEPALRMALQTREQHIRRNRATSNICTAQVLLAVLAAGYGIYHGPDGIRSIAERIRRLTIALRRGLRELGHEVDAGVVFDTLHVRPQGIEVGAILEAAQQRHINLRRLDDHSLGLSLDETVTERDLGDLLACFGGSSNATIELLRGSDEALPKELARTSPYMTHRVFHHHHSETEMLRYLGRLRSRDLSLCQSMTPLGSCTMKLNATAEMLPISWPAFSALHPFVPLDQAEGYLELFRQFESWLADITGFSAISLQPNAGSQGEFSGLLAIRAYHMSRNEAHRTVCLIPESAHGTNPASAVAAGMEVVSIACDAEGNIDVADVKAKAIKYADRLGALMVTYPSTHGVFEEAIIDICAIIHEHGGQVHFDGANLNALIGLSRPAELGADVCHMNLHKSFAIPHGGGGPGVGPIGVAPHLRAFLPGHPHLDGGDRGQGPVASAPWGSASVLPISWAYIAMMGVDGLKEATKIAILNANYVAKRLQGHFPVLYRGQGGFVAHECIIDVRPLKKRAGVTVNDVAKRLMDYGFHAPTMSWPVAGTLMVEPTESESLFELDRFVDAMLAIWGEAEKIATGDWPRDDNPLHHAPHTADMVAAEDWTHPYTRAEAGWPSDWSREFKFWPHVSRVDDVAGDRHLVCACPTVAEVAIEE